MYESFSFFIKLSSFQDNQGYLIYSPFTKNSFHQSTDHILCSGIQNMQAKTGRELRRERIEEGEN